MRIVRRILIVRIGTGGAERRIPLHFTALHFAEGGCLFLQRLIGGVSPEVSVRLFLWGVRRTVLAGKALSLFFSQPWMVAEKKCRESLFGGLGVGGMVS
jgi:hypothetical protein